MFDIQWIPEFTTRSSSHRTCVWPFLNRNGTVFNVLCDSLNLWRIPLFSLLPTTGLATKQLFFSSHHAAFVYEVYVLVNPSLHSFAAPIVFNPTKLVALAVLWTLFAQHPETFWAVAHIVQCTSCFQILSFQNLSIPVVEIWQFLPVEVKNQKKN